jgi:hypothetical protein
MKFTPEQRKLIKETRIKIKKLEDEQSALYTNLIKEIKMNPTAEEWMFDYLYNSFGTLKKIESLIK